MLADPKWRDEPWFKGGIHKIKFVPKVPEIEEIVNSPRWTKAIFLRHPFDRLVSCYKDKFGRDNKLYSVRMTGNRDTHILTFEEFLRMIAAPGSEHQNAHWRPQSRFCGLKKYISKFTFIGNFEKLQPHAELLLKGTDTWTEFGSNGWGSHNGSMFQRNSAAHRTSAGGVDNHIGIHKAGRLSIDAAKAAMSYDELLPPGSELRRLAFEYYKVLPK